MAPTVTDKSKSGTATGTTAAATPTLDLLCLLDSYDVAHGSGRTSQRAGLWKIGTARREKGGFHLGGSSTSINALNVREELRARAVVEVAAAAAASEPPLVDEESSSSKSTGKQSKETDSLFALHLDGMPKTDPKSDTPDKATDNENDDGEATLSTAISADADATSSTGLRQRKKTAQTAAGRNKKEEEETGKWTEEVPPQNVKLTPEQLEEEKLRTANPLDLFGGLPPPSLRAAQIEAREALAKYVEAANYAAEIIRLTNGAEERQQKRNDEE